MKQRAIIWFRRDLRLADNPALLAACQQEGVIPVYIHAPDEQAPWQPGGAQKVWLHFSLEALDSALSELGSRLVIRRGPSLAALRELIKESGAQEVHWNRLYEPKIIERDQSIKKALREDGVTVQSHNAALLCEPWQIKTQSGDPYKVFTPYWKNLAQKRMPAPQAMPDALPQVWSRIGSEPLESLDLLPRLNWDEGIRATWVPGEDGAHAALDEFLQDNLGDYDKARDVPARSGTSRLSPHLHFGEIGPRQIWHSVHEALYNGVSEATDANRDRFLSEVAWREFGHHLLFHFPQTPEEPLDLRFKNFPWNDNPQALQAWQRGQTGIPMVDAGMRQLWHTGWMHNRVRMVVASFLTKNLRVPWQHGAHWFWDTLVDADLANNTLGWQWVAGCGADAAPYFRIFNPALQGERFDKSGAYVRRWVPEIAGLPDKVLQRPWTAKQDALDKAGLQLGKQYPQPIVDLKASRRDALDAFAKIKNQDKS